MNRAYRKLILALAVALIAGCSTVTKPPPPAADAIQTRADTPLKARFSTEPVTGRNWNCPKCYS
ncbi:MAG TPA: hypothetical protein VFX94_03305 [Burkholderiales bacterium]|nr:hypothetical protein [Burkholderiales bacterium]